MTHTIFDKHLTHDRFPLRPGLCVVLFVFFSTREMECATAEFVDLRVDENAMVIIMSMSVSKNGLRAIGCERRWDCVCEAAPSARTCPYHAALELDACVKARFGNKK